jgi:hypothetical protein
MSEPFCTNPQYLGKLTHGHTRNHGPSAAYRSWASMLARCRGLTPKRHKDYVARGIKVCERWSGPGGFANFLADMGERPTGRTLERINNGGNYEPQNCRWATRKEQQRNRRENRLITHQGRTQCMAAWSEEMGLSLNTLEHRLRRNWTTERALTQPEQKKTKRS